MQHKSRFTLIGTLLCSNAALQAAVRWPPGPSGAVLRREDAMPSIGTDPVRVASGQMAPPRSNARRSLERHDMPVRCAGLFGEQADLPHRAESQVEWLRFLKRNLREVLPGLDEHITTDNRCKHEHAKVQAWLKRSRSFQTHSSPCRVRG